MTANGQIPLRGLPRDVRNFPETGRKQATDFCLGESFGEFHVMASTSKPVDHVLYVMIPAELIVSK